MPGYSIQLTLTNRQRKVRFDLPWLRRCWQAALPRCLARSDEGPILLAGLQQVECSILSDAAIGRVHDKFFHDPSPTDVITFPYGEILLGAGTIEQNAALHGHQPDHEALLCLIHGLLHLQGFDDLSPAPRQRMHLRQEQILQEVLAEV